MKKRTKEKIPEKGKNLSLVVRYLILLLFGIFISIFYKIFLPLTLMPVYLILKIFYNAILVGNMILIDTSAIELIGACIAGSAYYLLLILNLATPMKLKARLRSIVFSFAALLALNIARIVFLSALLVSGSPFFDATHMLFWYALSAIFVAGIWFLTIKIYKIKKVPLYSDIKSLIRDIKQKND